MVAVSDTSPISNLAIIGRLGLVTEQFGNVLVPSAVRQEVPRLRHAAAASVIDAAFADGWLRVTPLRQAAPGETAAGLHPGEEEAIVLALRGRLKSRLAPRGAGLSSPEMSRPPGWKTRRHGDDARLNGRTRLFRRPLRHRRNDCAQPLRSRDLPCDSCATTFAIATPTPTRRNLPDWAANALARSGSWMRCGVIEQNKRRDESGRNLAGDPRGDSHGRGGLWVGQRGGGKHVRLSPIHGGCGFPRGNAARQHRRNLAPFPSGISDRSIAANQDVDPHLPLDCGCRGE